MVDGLTSVDLGTPDYPSAVAQHEAYCKALSDCGVEVIVLDADERFPDSCFVEDVAVCARDFAVITRPGHASRRGETQAIRKVLDGFYSNIFSVSSAGTVEGGDILKVSDHFFIGLSERTNLKGALDVAGIFSRFGYTSSLIELQELLHLKTGVSCLDEEYLLVSSALQTADEFKRFNLVLVPDEEAYAANCIRVNDKVIVPSGYPKTSRLLKEHGFDIIEVDVSEFRKIDGGLSCLSLRF
jgi:dimethylargininase